MSDEPMDPAELAAWREAFRSLQEPGSSACPDDEILAALAIGTLAAGVERERLADHVAGCRRCAEDFRALLALHRAASKEGAPAEDRPARPWPRRTWLLALAAGLVLAVGLWNIVEAPRTVPPDEVAEEDRLRGGPIPNGDAERTVRPAPDARLAAAPRELAWPAQDGASGYRVALFDAASAPVWKSEVIAGTRLALPDQVRSRLQPRESYFWVVEVDRGGAGLEAARLGPFWFALQTGEERQP